MKTDIPVRNYKSEITEIQYPATNVISIISMWTLAELKMCENQLDGGEGGEGWASEAGAGRAITSWANKLY